MLHYPHISSDEAYGGKFEFGQLTSRINGLPFSYRMNPESIVMSKIVFMIPARKKTLIVKLLPIWKMIMTETIFFMNTRC